MFWLFGIPQLSGERLAALAALLGLFALASLPLTYFVQFLFQVRRPLLYVEGDDSVIRNLKWMKSD